MTRRTALYLCSVVLATAGCEVTVPPSTETAVDCTVEDAYEFENINNFTATDSGWYVYADPTKPTLAAAQAQFPNEDPASLAKRLGLAYQEATSLDSPGRCGDTRTLHLEAHGYNFWGSGFADWQHEGVDSSANGVDDDGKEYEGISFWARSAPNSEKTFLLFVDDGRTVILTRAKPVNGLVVDNVCVPVCTAATTVADAKGMGLESGHQCAFSGGIADLGVGCSALPPASETEDLNGDRFLGPGEIATGTTCRIPPPQSMGDPTCYGGGVQPPAAATRVPAKDECGNQFHAFVTTTDEWKFFTIPWSELVQWPCPNRNVGGIDKTDIRKFEIKFRQGTSYEVWIDNLAFYRRRANASQ